MLEKPQGSLPSKPKHSTPQHKNSTIQKTPHLLIEINGGIKTYEECNTHLQHDAVMIGREAYDPWLYADVDELYLEQNPTQKHESMALDMIPT